MYRIGKRLETSNWRLNICVENYSANKEWRPLQVQGSNQGKIAVTGQGQEPLLVNLSPIRRSIIIGKGAEVQLIGAWGMMR